MAILIKTPEQIDGIRKSSQLAALTLNYLKTLIQPGISTNAIDIAAEQFIREHNAIPAPLGYHGFPKSICTSINEVICHGIPSEKDVLKEGDILNVDVTTILDGYYGDTSTMFAVGEISKEAKRLMKVTEESLDIAIKQVYPGNQFGNIGFEIHRYVTRFGYSVVYQFVGHGVGVKFHEEPNILHVAKKYSGAKMEPGMIFTIEPMINEKKPEAVVSESDHWTARTADGALSAQYEHTILVTEKGHEILTTTN